MSDFGNRMEEARQRLPLRRLMEQHGKGPANGNWKSFPHCPFCAKKGGVGTFGDGNEERFKCHHASCPSGTAGEGGSWDQVGFLAYELRLNRKDAAITFLKEAGLWKEKEASPSILPGKTGRKKPLPSEADRGPRTEGRGQAEPPLTPSLPSDAERKKNLASAEVAPDAPGCNSGVVVSSASQAPGTIANANAPVEAPSQGEETSTGVEFNARPECALTGDLGSNISVPSPQGDVRSGCPSSQETSPALSRADAVSEEDKDSKIPAGGASPSADIDPSKIINMAGQPVAAPGTGIEQKETKPDGGYIIEAPPGQRSLEAFFARLSLNEADEKLLFEKRGLDSRTVKALQFRSNPKSNKEILLALSSQYEWEELFAAGLWVREERKTKKERRPNAKFWGYGIAGRKPNGDWEYKWNCPLIIPYFDEAGKLLSLRPHKDMGPGSTLTGTPHLYIPRDASLLTPAPTKPEIFETVVITEGEFKAAVLWQILGAGASHTGQKAGPAAIGIASLPGISFGKNYEVREELDGWLRRVKCRCVKVIYDNEEKGNPKFTGAFKSERRKRFDSQIWARYLAQDLAQKLHIRGEVGLLPNEWRNDNGKADWDGAMAQFAKAAA